MQPVSQFAISGAATGGATLASSPDCLERYSQIDSAEASIYFSCWIFVIGGLILYK